MKNADPFPNGINVSGYLRDESGWGAAGRGYIRALRRLDLPLAFNDFSTLSSNRSQDRALTQFDATNPYTVNLVCVDASQHYSLLSRTGIEYFDGHYNIGAWAWELPRFPQSWFDRFAYYDEIWVTTSFVANALAPLAPLPIVRIPPVLTAPEVGSRERGRRALNVQADEFVYLFIFDFHSHLARKNPLALISAFDTAFASSEPARLVIKCVNGDADANGLGALLARARGKRISIYDGYWSGAEMHDLMAACDVYVSLHRSEGTGLTITDAMAQGKPVIATGWSGNMDFMNVANSFPVRYQLVEIAETVGPYRAGQVWAEPSVEHAAELMRYGFEKRDEAKQRGQRAQRDLEANFSEEKIAALIRERLNAISVRQRFSEFQTETRRKFFTYQDSIKHIRATVSQVLPREATVIVVSKGDEELVKLGTRTAWHFPRNEQGIYAGYYPGDSADAIRQLEDLRARGGEYLLFPSTAFWWLDHYREFHQRLDADYARVWNDAHCIIYHLATPADLKREGIHNRMRVHV